MTFTFEGETWRIRFSHHHRPESSIPPADLAPDLDRRHKCVPVPAPQNQRARAVTRCYLEKTNFPDDLRGLADVSWTPVAVGIAACSLSDRFSRETGRKLSIKRMLEDAEAGWQLRTAVWASYFERPRGQKERALASEKNAASS